MSFFGTWFRYFRFIRSFISDLGGVGVFLSKAIGIFHDGGLKGTIEKVKHIFHHARKDGFLGTDRRSYQIWIKSFSLPEKEMFEKMHSNIAAFSFRPLVSILMPTFNTKISWLKAAIESVRNQAYENWELCIADDASTNSDCKKLLKWYAEKDPRIKVVFRENNGHISEASNSAMSMATGEWIALFDHDDLLANDALFWVVLSINKNPDLALIYSDEDKIDNKGRRSNPYFKSDWNYQLFLSQNMISHLGVYKSDIFKKIGGFRKGYEGSQDYDLALRFIDHIDHSQIIHIPRVLYHWRIHQDSTSVGSEKKPYAVIAAQKAISEHLERKAIRAEVEILPTHMYRVRYALPEIQPLVSIIIPTKNNPIILKQCINSILEKTSYSNYQITVVDNNSDDNETLDYIGSLKSHERISVSLDARDFNFSAINNKASQNAGGEYLCFLNDDTEVISEDWLSEMVSIAAQPGVGAVGAKLLYPDNTLQHGGIILGIGGIGSHAHKFIPDDNNGYFNRASLIQEFSAVTGACMLVKKSIFDEVGRFDEKNLTVAYNDVDLCLKMKQKGYRIVWTPYAELYHHESISRGNDIHPDKRKRFLKEIEFMNKTWGDIIGNDPAYSPNLTLTSEDFGLAWPPRLNENNRFL